MQIQSIKMFNYNHTNKQNFNGWKQNELNILHRNNEEMKILGVAFHTAPYEDIFEAAKIRNCIGIPLTTNTKESTIKLLEAIDAVKAEKINYKIEIEKLKQKAELRKKLSVADTKRLEELNGKINEMNEKSKLYKYKYYEDDPVYEEPKGPTDEEAYKDFVEHFIRL